MTEGRRRAICTVAILSALTIALVGSPTARALPPGPPTRSASTVASFAGTTFDQAAGETVDLAGALHVVVRVTGSTNNGWTLDWHANVDHASGTGETTQDHYLLTGADSGSVAYPPGPPVRTAFFEPTFTLYPPGPPTHPPSPCRFLIAVSFDEAQNITSVDAHLAESPPPTTD